MQTKKLTITRGGSGYHDAQVRRRARPRDDGRGEQPGGRQLAPRAQPQHLEIAHLAGDAVPLPPPCAPPYAIYLCIPPVPPSERYRREGELVSGGLDAVHVKKGS